MKNEANKKGKPLEIIGNVIKGLAASKEMTEPIIEERKGLGEEDPFEKTDFVMLEKAK